MANENDGQHLHSANFIKPHYAELRAEINNPRKAPTPIKLLRQRYMRILNKIKAAFLLGRAFKKFEQKRYNEALDLFELIQSLSPDMERKEVVYYHVGMSYHELGKNIEGLQALAKAYDVFKSKIYHTQDENYLRIFLSLVSVYAQLLKDVGKAELSASIFRTRDTVLSSRGYDLDNVTGKLVKKLH